MRKRGEDVPNCVGVLITNYSPYRNIKERETIGDNRNYFKSNYVSEPPPPRTTSPHNTLTNTHSTVLRWLRAQLKRPEAESVGKVFSAGAYRAHGAGCAVPDVSGIMSGGLALLHVVHRRPPTSLSHIVPATPLHAGKSKRKGRQQHAM